MNENEILTAVGSLGFPIVLSVYLLNWFRKSLDDLTCTMGKHNTLLEKLIERIEKDAQD